MLFYPVRSSSLLVPSREPPIDFEGKRRCVRPRSLVQARLRLWPSCSLHLTPLLAGRSETEAEAQVAEAEGGAVPAPIRATGAVRQGDPRTAALDAVRAVRRTNRVTHGTTTRKIPVPILKNSRLTWTTSSNRDARSLPCAT